MILSLQSNEPFKGAVITTLESIVSSLHPMSNNCVIFIRPMSSPLRSFEQKTRIYACAPNRIRSQDLSLKIVEDNAKHQIKQ